MKRLLCLAVIALIISACTVTDRKNKLAVAAITGGLAGAFVGFEIFGSGTSGLLGGAAIGGVSAGAAYLVADTLLPREAQSLNNATYDTLQNTPSGQTSTWSDPNAETTASITPMRNFRTKDGRLCRDFVVVFRIGESRESVKRTACQGFDGSWQTI